VTWFGTFTTAHHTTILSHYTKMAADAYADYTVRALSLPSSLIVMIQNDVKFLILF
jgi:hypothetical protein